MTAAEPKVLWIRARGLEVTSSGETMGTVVGSCVAVCLFDAVAGVGGMNHYLLPEQPEGGRPDPLRYGRQAIPALLEKVQEAGARLEDLVAKVAGGAHVLRFPGAMEAIPRANIDVAREELDNAGVRLAGEHVGGEAGRRLWFDGGTGSLRVELGDGVMVEL